MNDNPKRWLEHHLSKKNVQRAAKLLNEQCWCWGADIRYPDGNLLLTYGFRRERAPSPQAGSNMYMFHPSPTQQVILWGWGMFYSKRSVGGLFLGRNGFAPMMTSIDMLSTPVFTATELPSLFIPRTEKEYQITEQLIGNGLRWIAGYETWVLSVAGECHRLACLSEWRKRPVTGCHAPEQWSCLAAQIETALKTAGTFMPI
jgi:hypothetical protein